MTDDLRTSSPLKSPPILTDSGILQTFLDETGVLEIKVSDLRDKLHDLKYNQVKVHSLFFVCVGGVGDGTIKMLHCGTGVQERPLNARQEKPFNRCFTHDHGLLDVLLTF